MVSRHAVYKHSSTFVQAAERGNTLLEKVHGLEPIAKICYH